MQCYQSGTPCALWRCKLQTNPTGFPHDEVAVSTRGSVPPLEKIRVRDETEFVQARRQLDDKAGHQFGADHAER